MIGSYSTVHIKAENVHTLLKQPLYANDSKWCNIANLN